ncbi:UNVERIFIED_ORG: helix-turn-helix transcriptional regulator (plasmid) [Roseateles sp. XES5]|nr:helix-turn-helix transcriptional regulator [Roseateles sp. XES5]
MAMRGETLPVAGKYDLAARLIGCAGRASFETELTTALKRELPIDAALLLIYQKDRSPRLLFHDWTTKRGILGLQKYLGGPYLRDPFYGIAVEEPVDGLYALSEIAPSNFTHTQYYREYYRDVGFGDEFNYLFRMDEHVTFAISLSRQAVNGPFEAGDIGVLQDLEPLLRSAVARHWSDLNPASDTPSANPLGPALQHAMSRFGTSVLTERECEIARLILRGYSLKGAAEQLSISETTVKLHRSNLYAKLDITSQTELFSLFIASVSAAPNLYDDPLEHYLN